MNQIFLEIGNFKIYWYSVILLVAFSLGIYLAIKESKKQGLNMELISDYCFYMVPICLLGARIYYVLFNLDYYSSNLIEIFKVWEGGLAIHGGVIAGLIYTIFYTKKYNLNFLQITDIFCISLIIGQIIGRWGNFMNGEAFGPATNYSNLKSLYIPEFIINGMKINGIYHHPTFLYESLWNLIGLIILMIIKKLYKTKKDGFLTSIYLIWYGIGRFLIESLRQDSLMLFNFKVAQLVSILYIISGIIIFIIIYRKKRVKN